MPSRAIDSPRARPSWSLLLAVVLAVVGLVRLASDLITDLDPTWVTFLGDSPLRLLARTTDGSVAGNLNVQYFKVMAIPCGLAVVFLVNGGLTGGIAAAERRWASARFRLTCIAALALLCTLCEIEKATHLLGLPTGLVKGERWWLAVVQDRNLSFSPPPHEPREHDWVKRARTLGLRAHQGVSRCGSVGPCEAPAVVTQCWQRGCRHRCEDALPGSILPASCGTARGFTSVIGESFFSKRVSGRGAWPRARLGWIGTGGCAMSKVRVSSKPGQPGTKGLVARYGKRLICVRHRYDEQTKQRVKTVELIVGRSDWQPEARRRREGTVVAVRVDWHETGLRRKVKAAGGRWDPKKRVWVLGREHVERLGLEGRVVEGSL